MKSIFAAIFLALLTAIPPTPATAEITSRVIYSYRDWQVRLVNYGDGRLRCQARVSRGGYSFSIWASPTTPVRLQFYGTSWSFGASHRANLKVRIDGNASWRMSNAELYKHSVLFNLPSSSQGTKFLLQVASGETLRLYNDRGSHVHTYSLSGSRASISALINCNKALRGGGNRSSDPFS